MGRLAFVTGATGFVGTHLVRQLLDEGWRVRSLVRPTSRVEPLLESGVELCLGDLRDRDALRQGLEGADTVFHLAAVTAARSEQEYHAANTLGTRSLVSALGSAGRRPRRLVYLSSYAAAGPSRGAGPRPLDLEPEPLTAYGRTKLAGERLAWSAELPEIGVVVIRAPAIYGPGDRALLPYFQFVNRGVAPLPAGNARKLHMLFAPDLAGALVRAADRGVGTLAIADPREYAWLDLIEAMAAALQRRPLRIRLPARLVRSAAAGTELVGRLLGRAVAFNREKAEEMLAPAWTCDLSGSEELLAPEQVTPLLEGMERTVRWYIREGWL